MPFSRPTRQQLQDQALSDIAAQLAGADPLLPKANLRIIGRVQGEGFAGAYEYVDYVSKQAIPATAKDEALEFWAALKGVLRKAASYATGQWSCTGATPTTVLPSGTQVVRGDGWTYSVDADATVAGDGTLSANLTSVTAGSGGTLVNGSALAISTAIPGIPSGGVAIAGVAGSDVELDDSLRTRMLEAYSDPPQGGALSDYVQWALKVAGVTRAWCVPNGRGPGTVVVYSMMDVTESAFGGFPQGTGGVAAAETRDTPATQDLLATANYIFPLRPVTPIVYSLAPLKNTVNITIALAGASAGLKAQIAAAVGLVFLAFGDPLGGTVDISDIEAAITVFPEAEGFVITAVSCNHGSVSPTDGNITSTAGYLPVLGTISWS